MTRRPVGGVAFNLSVNDAALIEENRILRERLAAKDREVAQLRHRLDLLCRRLFGRQAESVDPNQLKLAFELLGQEDATEPSAVVDEAPDVETPPKKRKGHGRGKLPEDLPRERIEYHPPAEQLKCGDCGGDKRRLDGAEEITEELEYQPASFFVREHVRVKYACQACQSGVACGVLPARVIEKGRPGPGLLAQVMTAKYCDHLPLNRLEKIFERHGVSLSRSTLCDWVSEAAFLVRPIVNEIKNEALSAFVVQTDDTPIRVLDKSAPHGSKQGRLWVYRGEPGSVVFDYTESRARDGPERFLDDRCGYLQADAYAGYDQIFRKGRQVEVGCWAHARRKFFESLESEPLRAAAALGAISSLYQVEREAAEAGLDSAARGRLRKEKSAPRLLAFMKWLETEARSALPASPFGMAVNYTLKLRVALARYLEDGRIPIDNNAVERCIRTVAVGRKNWLFAGNDNGGERGAAIYSLVVSCKELELDVFEYLRDVFRRVSVEPSSRIGELTPRGWKAARITKSS